MIYDQMTGALYDDSGMFLKTVHCPLALRPEQLSGLLGGNVDRFCHACNKKIRCIDQFSDDDMRSAVSEDEDVCVFATNQAKNIIFLRPIGYSAVNYPRAPTIRTVRSLEAMVDALARGYTLIFKNAAKDSINGSQKYIVYQHIVSGKLWWSNDYEVATPCSGNQKENINEWKLIRDWFYSRPDRPFPLAAYAVPVGIKSGARVFLEDLIVDSFEITWRSQGDGIRRLSSLATWTGTDFNVDDPDSAFLSG